MMRYRAAALIVAALAVASCDKNAVQDITGSPPDANIKFFNFGVNAPSVNFYADNTKMTATSSTTGVEATTGVSYGGVGSGGFYGGIDAGAHTLSGRIAATTDKDLAISNLQTTIEAGKKYSYYLSGFYNTAAKTIDSFIVEDPFIAQFDYSVAYVRFVNAISNSSPMTLYATLQSGGTETAVGGVVAYKSAGAFTALPPGVYNLATRTAGSSTNAIVRTAVSFSPGRVYTIAALGDITVTSSTATNRARLDNTINR